MININTFKDICGLGKIKTIELTAFTYDSEDDFIDNEYRGNSKATLIIVSFSL